MAGVVARLEPYGYAALRIVAGALFVFHGLQKLGFFGGRMVDLASQLGAAATIETIGGVLIAIGAFTVPTAAVASGEMAVAYVQAHQPRGGWPIQNGGELALLYCFIFLLVALRGAGPLSIDRLRGRR